ncbi:GON-4-like protein [Cricetulus griseus]|uniref:GON-4-like protein n=1 Tax=Cricetulus griseus TaxID=10029 RepID=G3HGA9_CRIGR|nr:GON-4-like protein [Cricetulus griseus]
MLSVVHKAASPKLGRSRPSPKPVMLPPPTPEGPSEVGGGGKGHRPACPKGEGSNYPTSLPPEGWTRSGTCTMLPCKKRRATVTESVHQQDSQEGDDLDLESSVKPESVQLKDLASESLSWDQHHESAVCPEVDSSHDVENQLSVEDPSLRPKMLTQHGNPPVLEAVDGAIAQEIALPSLESSHSLTVHMDKERLQATASRKGKKIVFPPGLVTREDQGDHPVMEEPPSGEPGEEVMAEGGKGERSRLLFPCLFRLSIPDLKLYTLKCCTLNLMLGCLPPPHCFVCLLKQPPQFVDIHLEEDDSSDEEYQPDEEEEDETAEEVEKVTTPAVRHISAEVVPMGPPPPPKPKQSRDSAFMEKLNAVDEELASSPVCMDSFQPMEDSLIAFRTRSKMPLKDVPLGQLELQAPDITVDMYNPTTANNEDWKLWLGGLLNDDVENEDEADDDDDPEYNFLEDLDEPDTEDFRTDRAVRITKKEVNGLMEELFETVSNDFDLLALGLKHFEGTEFPKPLISKYLVTCKTAHQLTVRIKNLNQNRAPNNVIKFYKKTKQLPVLVRCCEEIQPHQWKPPIEKEEHQLPFWLKASLQSIQDELRNIAEGPAEGENVTPAPETSTDHPLEKASPELGTETRYPLLMPKGVVLKLKPGSKRFSRRAWRQKRPLAQKPLLIQPSPCVQPALNLGKMATWPIQSEVPPGNIVVQIPHLIQPTPVLQTLQGFPPVGVSSTECIESPAAALPAMPSGPEARTSFSLSESQSLLSSSSAPKIMLPSLAPSKFQKPFLRPKPMRRKGAKLSPCVKPAPIVHPTPVIFAVPATTVKVVSLGSGCNVIQPVNAAVAPNPQTIPITTLLVNPTPFPCQLNQPLVASSIPPLIVSGNSLTLPVPSIPEDNAHVNLDVTEGMSVLQNPDSTLKPQEPTSLCATVFSKEDPVPWHPSSGTESQETSSELSSCGWAIVKTESQEASSESSACVWTVVKTENQEASSESSAYGWTVVKTESQEASSESSACGWTVVKTENQEASSESSPCGWTVVKTENQEASSESSAYGWTVVKTESQEASSESSACGWTVVKTENQEASSESSACGWTVVKTENHEASSESREKDGPEDEEEEEFDELTQDEEDELSSASEESVLSVPELQETMEKLTWLASERSMSQEGESEEENSQEENSEPEEEEEEEAEGMEALQKEGDVNDEAVGDAAEKQPSTLASPKTAPQVETSVTPAEGKSMYSRRPDVTFVASTTHRMQQPVMLHIRPHPELPELLNSHHC